MGVASWLKGLFGGPAAGESEASPAQAVEYKGYLIIPQPQRQGGQFLTSGLIAKDFPEGRKEQRFIRADTHASEDEARQMMVQKAQRLIDEMGDRLFGGA